MPPNGRKRQKPDQKVMKEIIHSGHFMVSDIDDSEIQDGEDGTSLVVHESDCDQENISLPVRGFDFESACKETSKTYHFGARSSHCISIDASLTKLFECMTLAYSGKLTSPRWKQFKGLKLRLKEKIRLNNMIWRAWHMQFVMKIKTFVCQFATPIDGEMHSKPEAVVIEGTYWKRRLTNITAEYQKWRLFYKDRSRLQPSLEAGNMAMDLDMRWPSWSKDSYSSLQSTIDEDLLMDFSDTLFSTFNPSQPFDFPNPREIAARAGIADFIQPGLVQLQPTVDDFMDTFEPLQDFFTDFLNSRLPSLPEEVSSAEDMMQSTADPQSLMNANYRNPFDGSPLSNMLNQANSQMPSIGIKRNSARKHSLQRTLQHPLLTTTQFSGKPMVDIMSSNMSDPLLQGSLSANQAPVQNFVCSENSVTPNAVPANNATVVSIVQQNTDHSIKMELAESSGSSGTVGNPLLLQKTAKERTNRFLQKPAFLSRSFEEASLSHYQNTLVQSPHKIQVPMETIQQGQVSNNTLSNITSDSKSQQHPMFFSVSSGQFSKGTMGNDSFLVPLQVSNVSSLTESKFQTTSLLKDTGASNSPVMRRHSYTTGQALHSPVVTADYMGSRRSRPIAPVTTVPANFVVPEAPARQRTRSRSVSSPQSNKPKPNIQQPSQATSLTDVSSSLRSAIVQQDLCYKKPMGSSILVNPTSHVAATNVLPQNAVLAQLLSGNNQEMIKVSTETTTNCTSPLTIIRPLPALVSTSAHTLVFSPIPIATAAGVSDFQRSLLVSAANHVFGSPSPSSPPSVLPSQSPDSTGSSTCSSSPAISSVAFDPNSSSSKTVRVKSDEERTQYKEHRRVCHINAEQKRRCNIKNGFESLHNLLPPVGQSSNSKVSKAAMLQRGAEYIRTLKTEREQQKEEAELLKKQIDELNQAISLYQSQLPASGAPVSCQKTNKMKEMFEEYVRQQTFQNWKFWIFSLILEPLVESYNNNVSTANIDEMCKSILTWLDQHCSLVALRPGVLNSLRHLSTTTNILSDPSQMPEEATRAVTKKEKKL